MSKQQLWKQSQNLTHHSLEAFLLSIIQRPNIYNLYQFLSHPQISTVQQNVLNLYKLFITSSFKTFPKQKLKQLSQKKVNKLKKITILKLFEGLTEIQLQAICNQISSSKQQVIDTLIEMSIAGSIDIKIDEKESKVEIHYAQVPGREFSQQETINLESKISHIINKNQRILSAINEAYHEIRVGNNEHTKGY